MGGDYCTGGDDQMGGDDRSYSRNGTILAIYIINNLHAESLYTHIKGAHDGLKYYCNDCFFFLVDPGFTPEAGPGVIQIMTYTEKCKMDHK